jgi:hypothetical protein
MSNRVEELESKVAELQAAVNGLTEELVETKERVRLLEDQVEVDLTAGTRPVGHADRATPDSDPEPVEETPNDPRESPAQAESRSETSEDPATDADFIDADADAVDISDSDDVADDENKSDEDEEADEAEAPDDSDIIVA